MLDLQMLKQVTNDCKNANNRETSVLLGQPTLLGNYCD